MQHRCSTDCNGSTQSVGERFDELKAMWESYRADPAALPPFAEGVERYSQFHWLHMRKEEERVLPLAAEALAQEDWDAIDAAFASNADPVVGVPASKAFRELFRHLVAIVPPPLGVGPGARRRAGVDPARPGGRNDAHPGRHHRRRPLRPPPRPAAAPAPASTT